MGVWDGLDECEISRPEILSQSTPGCRGPNNCFLKCPSASISHAHTEAPSSWKESVQSIMGARSVHQLHPSKSFILKGPFEVASFEHFGLERPFNMAAMIVFTQKCPSEGDISRLECTMGLLAGRCVLDSSLRLGW